MRLIQPGLLRQLLTKRFRFTDRVTVQHIARFIAFVGALAQSPQTAPLGGHRSDAGPDDQRPGDAAAQRNPVLGLPGVSRPLHALRHDADAEDRQSGADHPPPQAAFGSQNRLHHRFRRPLFLFAGHQPRWREVVGLQGVEGASAFQRRNFLRLQRPIKINPRF